MKNIHVLPTDNYKVDYKLQNSDAVIQVVKLGQLIFDSSLKEFRINKNPSWAASCDTDVLIPHNIYITSDEKIKEGDWYYHLERKTINNTLEKADYFVNNTKYDKFKKIILTTDQDLIEDGVQAINDEFLEWFVKNPSCEKVYTSVMKTRPRGSNDEWKVTYGINIPKEEPKPHSFCETPEEKCTMNYCDENGCQNRKRELVEPKPKQETLEEFIQRQLSLGKYQDQESAIKYSILAGAKWQQERMYNEEELLNFADFYHKYKELIKAEKWEIIEMSKEEVFKKWFEQFKKK